MANAPRPARAAILLTGAALAHAVGADRWGFVLTLIMTVVPLFVAASGVCVPSLLFSLGLGTEAATAPTLASGVRFGLSRYRRRLPGSHDEVFACGQVHDELTLARFDRANRTMRETTRLHPAGVVSPREAARHLCVGGHRIPEGTLILWSAHLAGRDPQAWTDPLRFDPDRFVRLTGKQKALADAAWVPFGRGARNCIGFALAQMELTLIISRIAQRLDIASSATEIPRSVGMVVNRPDGGAPMRVSARGPSPG